MAVLFALLASLFIGINTILIKKSLSGTNSFTAAALLTFIGAVFFWLLAAVSLPPISYEVNRTAIMYFFIAGIFAPALVRWLFFASLNSVGPSVSSSIMASMPAFSVMIAVLFRHEHLSITIALGLFMIIGGIILFERTTNPNNTAQKIRKGDLVLPSLAAIVAAVAINLRKQGLQELNLPVLAAAVGFGSASIVYLLSLLMSSEVRKHFKFSISDLPIFIAAGLSLGLGWLCILYALSHGPVVLVSPLTSLHPLVVLVFSSVFLKDVEKITPQIVIGSCIIVLGVVMITTV